MNIHNQWSTLVIVVSVPLRSGRRPRPAGVRRAVHPEAPQIRVRNDPDCPGIRSERLPADAELPVPYERICPSESGKPREVAIRRAKPGAMLERDRGEDGVHDQCAGGPAAGDC